MDSDTYLIDRLRQEAQRLRHHADLMATRRVGALWRILRWRTATCLVELRTVADHLTRAADRLEVLTHRDDRATADAEDPPTEKDI